MAKPNISFEDLLKVDVRLGHVITAEAIPKEKGYLKLQVDFGPEGTRTVITNLGKQFAPESFIDKLLPFVLNFPPLPVAKQMSEAMILASSPEGSKMTSLLISAGGSPGDIVI